MPQIANQDYNLILNDGKTNVQYPVIRALNRGTIFDVVIDNGAGGLARVTEVRRITSPSEIQINYGSGTSRIDLFYSEETYATIYDMSLQLGEQITIFAPDDDDFLTAQEVYVACNGFLCKITANDDDVIVKIEISDTPVGDRAHVDVTPEQLQTLVGVAIY